MSSEINKGMVRICSNYGRLTATVVIGIALVKAQFTLFGDAGFGVLSLIGASIGFGAMFQDLIRRSLIRELGAAWHAPEPAVFASVYNSAFVVSGAMSVLSLLAFGAIMAIIQLMRVPDEFATSVVVYLGAEGAFTFLLVLLAPAFNMYVVAERFIAYNLWVALHRSSYLAAALIMIIAGDDLTPGATMMYYIIAAVSFNTVMLFAFVINLLIRDHRLIPRPSMIDRGAVREIAHTSSWNNAVIIGMNLHERIAPFIINAFFGPIGNAIWGVAFRLVSYVRMLTLGMTFGVDAVSTRLSADEDSNKLLTLTRHSTRLHAMAAIPSALAVFVLADPIYRLWLGRNIQNTEQIIPAAVLMVRILVLGSASRAISDSWIRILYGAGHIRRYAPVVLIGGIFNPLLTVGLIFLLPDSISLNAPALAFTLILTVAHLILLPAVGAPCLGVRLRDMLSPIAKPAVVALLASVVPIAAEASIERWTLPLLAATGLAFGAVYGLLAYALILSSPERRRLTGLVVSRLRRAG